MQKPVWLDKKVDLSLCRKTKVLLKGLNLSTVCEEARCPNISECFDKGTATFMILGDICTRNCAFCGVTKGLPLPVDENEPGRVKEAVERLRIEYVVLTSPTRDDLADGGASGFARTIREVRTLSFVKKIEVLIPDFSGIDIHLRTVIGSCPDATQAEAIIGHEYRTPKKGNLSAIGTAYAVLVLAGYDPLNRENFEDTVIE